MGAGHQATRLRQQAAQYRKLGDLAAIQPEEVRARRTAAEEAYTNVVSRLGAEGTYGPGAPTAGASTESVFKEADIQSSLEGPMYKEGGEGLGKTGQNLLEKKGYLPSGSVGKTSIKGQIIDPEKFQKKVEGSAQFRIASQLTAEAEQLINREGPLYEEMLNNLQLPIIEGSAALARENTEQLRRAMQRGGSARRSAFEAVQKMRAQERINSQKIQQLAQVRGSLDSWARENARTVLDFGQNWVSNLGGIRESYQKAMDSAAEMMLTEAMPLVFRAEGAAADSEAAAAEVRAKMHAENRQKTGQWVTGILSVASLALGGVGILAGAADATGGLGSLAGAITPYSGSLISTGIKLGTSALGQGGQQ